MLRKRFIQVSLLITLMAISHTGFAQDTDGFYVIPIPVPTDEVVEVEVCNGTPIGAVAFTIALNGFIYFGDIYSTTAGHLVEITGGYVSYDDGSVDVGFRAAPSSLPPPTGYGVKGPYYAIHNGNIMYARFL
jgi:hypothetical protein